MAWKIELEADTNREMSRNQTLREVSDEMSRAESKHGDYAFDGSLIDNLQLLGGLGEEFGEVARALTYDQDHSGGLRKELIQLAASATAWASTLSPKDDSREVSY